MAKLLITYRKSTIGYSEDQKRTVRSLGLRKLNQKVLQPDNAAVRGMVFKVQHLLTVEEVGDDYSIPVREPWARPRVIGRVEGATTAPAAGRATAPAAGLELPARDEPAPALQATRSLADEPLETSASDAQAPATAVASDVPVPAMRVTTTLAAEELDEAAASEAEPLAATTPEAQDLEIIEGIGPKIAGLLRENGITTFADLAATSITTLEEILQAANLRLADVSTWAEQAGLAADGKWDELRALQDRLQGGRVIE